MACSSILLGAPGKKTLEATPPPRKLPPFAPRLPSEFPLLSVGKGGGGGGGGGGVFSGNYKFWFDNVATVNHVTISYPVHSRVPFVSLFLSQLPSVYLLSR